MAPFGHSCHIRGRHGMGRMSHTSVDQTAEARTGEPVSEPSRILCQLLSLVPRIFGRAEGHFGKGHLLMALRVRALTVFMFTSPQRLYRCGCRGPEKGSNSPRDTQQERWRRVSRLRSRTPQLVFVPSPQAAPQIHWGSPAAHQVSGDESKEPPAQLPGLGTLVEEHSRHWTPRSLQRGSLCVP